jgi:hypothetical protein
MEDKKDKQINQELKVKWSIVLSLAFKEGLFNIYG